MPIAAAVRSARSGADADDDRDRAREGEAHQREDLAHAGDARTFVVVPRKFRAPRAVRDRDHRPAEIEDGDPDQKMRLGGVGRRQEQHIDAECEHRRAEQHPGAAAAQAPGRAIAGVTDDGIDEEIGEAGDEKDQTHRLDVDLEILGVELRDEDRDRKSGESERDRELPEADDGRPREALAVCFRLDSRSLQRRTPDGLPARADSRN